MCIMIKAFTELENLKGAHERKRESLNKLFRKFELNGEKFLQFLQYSESNS